MWSNWSWMILLISPYICYGHRCLPYVLTPSTWFLQRLIIQCFIRDHSRMGRWFNLTIVNYILVSLVYFYLQWCKYTFLKSLTYSCEPGIMVCFFLDNDLQKFSCQQLPVRTCEREVIQWVDVLSVTFMCTNCRLNKVDKHLNVSCCIACINTFFFYFLFQPFAFGFGLSSTRIFLYWNFWRF